MRYFLLGIFLISVSGCGGAPPAMAGGKWAEALRNPDDRVRKQAAFTLGNIGPSDPAVLPALIGALKDRDAGVRAEAALGLLRIGPAAKEAVPALQEAARKDTNPTVRAHAGKALEKVQSGS